VVLTVDTPVVGTKYVAERSVWDTVDPADLRVNFDAGYDPLGGGRKARDLGPDDIAWVAELTGLPVVAKGVLHPDDARRCIESAASAVWVSNHGGRQLDRTMTTASALPAVVAAVQDRGEVYVDGGIRSGLDVLAALALGADAAFLGRLPLYALAEGEEGVARLHTELAAQVSESLRLAGCRTPAEACGLAHEGPI
jgi:4-hydroxymandelate oxidase